MPLRLEEAVFISSSPCIGHPICFMGISLLARDLAERGEVGGNNHTQSVVVQ